MPHLSLVCKLSPFETPQCTPHVETRDKVGQLAAIVLKISVRGFDSGMISSNRGLEEQKPKSMTSRVRPEANPSFSPLNLGTIHRGMAEDTTPDVRRGLVYIANR